MKTATSLFICAVLASPLWSACLDETGGASPAIEEDDGIIVEPAGDPDVEPTTVAIAPTHVGDVDVGSNTFTAGTWCVVPPLPAVPDTDASFPFNDANFGSGKLWKIQGYINGGACSTFTAQVYGNSTQALHYVFSPAIVNPPTPEACVNTRLSVTIDSKYSYPSASWNRTTSVQWGEWSGGECHLPSATGTRQHGMDWRATVSVNTTCGNASPCVNVYARPIWFAMNHL